MALNPSGRERQDGIEPVQGLDGGLFVDAEDGSMLGRVQVETDDVGSLGLEVGIVAGHVTLQTVRLQAGLPPDAVHGVLADAQSGGQLAATPVRRAILGRLARGGKNPRPQLGRQHRGLLSRMRRIQPVEPRSQKALFPAADGWRGGSQPQLDGTVLCAFRQHQDQFGAKDIPSRQRSGLGNAAQLQLLVFGEKYDVAGHIRLDVIALVKFTLRQSTSGVSSEATSAASRDFICNLDIQGNSRGVFKRYGCAP